MTGLLSVGTIDGLGQIIICCEDILCFCSTWAGSALLGNLMILCSKKVTLVSGFMGDIQLVYIAHDIPELMDSSNPPATAYLEARTAGLGHGTQQSGPVLF